MWRQKGGTGGDSSGGSGGDKNANRTQNSNGLNTRTSNSTNRCNGKFNKDYAEQQGTNLS